MSSEKYYTMQEVANIFGVNRKRIDKYLSSETLVCNSNGYFRFYDLQESCFLRPFLLDRLAYLPTNVESDILGLRAKLLEETPKFHFQIDKTLRTEFKLADVAAILGFKSRSSIYKINKHGYLNLSYNRIGYRVVTKNELRRYLEAKRGQHASLVEPLYSSLDISIMLDVSKSCVCNWCRSGRLQGERKNEKGNWYILQSKFIAFLTENPTFITQLKESRLADPLNAQRDEILARLPAKKLYSRADVANILRVSDSAISVWVKKGWIAPCGYDFGWHAIFDDQSIKDFVQKRPEYRKIFTAYNRRREDAKVS